MTPPTPRPPHVDRRVVAQPLDPQQAGAALPRNHRAIRPRKFLAASIPNTLRVDELIAISEHLGIPVARFTEPPEPAECVS